jgi:hypothetical protein
VRLKTMSGAAIAATVCAGLDVIDLGFQPHNLATPIVPIHGGQVGADKLA